MTASEIDFDHFDLDHLDMASLFRDINRLLTVNGRFSSFKQAV